jgi:hypothetical protein
MPALDTIIRNRRDAENALIVLSLPRRKPGTFATPRQIENAMLALHLERATRAAVNAAEAPDPFARSYHRELAEREFVTALAILELPRHRHANTAQAWFMRPHGDPRWTFFHFGRCARCDARLAGRRCLHIPKTGAHLCAHCGRPEMAAFQFHRSEQSALASCR